MSEILESLNTHKKCKCHFCQVQYPAMQQIEAELTTEDSKKKFNDLMNDLMHDSENADYWEARAKGDWPMRKVDMQAMIDNLQKKCDLLLD